MDPKYGSLILPFALLNVELYCACVCAFVCVFWRNRCKVIAFVLATSWRCMDVCLFVCLCALTGLLYGRCMVVCLVFTETYLNK